MHYILTTFVSLAVTLLSAFGIYNYAPLSLLEYGQSKNLGSTITTINGSDTLKDSRAVINTNFSNLNTDKAELTVANTFTALNKFSNASSTLFSCYGPCYFGATATSSFSTAGALTLITPLTVANGGTGSTTLSSNQVLLGNGTGNIGLVAGYGTTDQVLSSNGSASAPTWKTYAVDQAIAYTWTGIHTFNNNTNVFTGTAPKVGIATSSPYAALSVVGEVVAANFTATSTTATSTMQNLRVATNATTTTLTISNTCTGCPMAYTASSTSVSLTSGSQTFTGSIPTLANTALISFSISDSDGAASGVLQGTLIITRSGLTSAVAQVADNAGAGEIDGGYSFAWSGSNLVVTEESDAESDSSLTATVYYYK